MLSSFIVENQTMNQEPADRYVAEDEISTGKAQCCFCHRELSASEPIIVWRQSGVEITPLTTGQLLDQAWGESPQYHCCFRALIFCSGECQGRFQAENE
jgi:hypothetical protein